ncbi:hypothetical protein QTP70_019907 [Hemibagrus guttatus]|uniref:Uncharacterized protein n=1 Tax=Hemibagrus guttatus TaxID=175788 RepID=A0AAE0UQU0_9TELE|nr:hypothetical protein QTP70_019907 [Hemibagrus guttatus]
MKLNITCSSPSCPTTQRGK